MTQGPMDGYFAPAAPVPPGATYGTPAGAPLPGTPGASGAPGAPGLPPYVVAAVTSLGLASVAGTWVALTSLVALHALDGVADGSILLKTVLLLADCAAHAVLGVRLLQGWAPARVLVSVSCGWWVLYWLAKAGKAHSLLGDLSSFGGVGQVAAMATLGVLLLSAWAAATIALLWAPGNARHFSG